LAATASAQPRAIDLKGSIGLASFVDEDPENHLHTGVAARFYLTRRFSVEPELLYLRQSSSHDDIVLAGNVNWDFRTGRVTPYVSGGIGYMRSRFGRFTPTFSSSEGFLQVGGGAKIYLSDSWFVSPEARIGWEPHVRLSVGIGYTFRP
jgi:hypothetical protein